MSAPPVTNGYYWFRDTIDVPPELFLVENKRLYIAGFADAFALDAFSGWWYGPLEVPPRQVSRGRHMPKKTLQLDLFMRPQQKELDYGIVCV